MDKKQLSRLATVVLILLLLCYLFGYLAPSQTEVAAQQKAPTYPSQWEDIGMTAIPDGSVVWSSGGNSLDEGVQFELEVDRPTDDIANYLDEEFYDKEFDETDWADEEDGFSSSYNSGNVDVTVDVRPGPGGKKKRVRISINRRPDRIRTPSSYTSVIVD